MYHISQNLNIAHQISLNLTKSHHISLNLTKSHHISLNLKQISHKLNVSVGLHVGQYYGRGGGFKKIFLNPLYLNIELGV